MSSPAVGPCMCHRCNKSFVQVPVVPPGATAAVATPLAAAADPSLSPTDETWVLLPNAAGTPAAASDPETPAPTARNPPAADANPPVDAVPVCLPSKPVFVCAPPDPAWALSELVLTSAPVEPVPATAPVEPVPVCPPSKPVFVCAPPDPAWALSELVLASAPVEPISATAPVESVHASAPAGGRDAAARPEADVGLRPWQREPLPMPLSETTAPEGGLVCAWDGSAEAALGVVDRERFERRLRLWLGAALDGLPWDGVVLTGGLAEGLARPVVHEDVMLRSDADLFVFGATEQQRYDRLYALLDHLQAHGARFSVRPGCSVVDVAIGGAARPVQLVLTEAPSVADVLRSFDLTHAQWAYRAGRLLATPEAVRAYNSMRTEVTGTRVLASRLHKACARGYSLHSDHPVLVTHATSGGTPFTSARTTTETVSYGTTAAARRPAEDDPVAAYICGAPRIRDAGNSAVWASATRMSYTALEAVVLMRQQAVAVARPEDRDKSRAASLERAYRGGGGVASAGLARSVDLWSAPWDYVALFHPEPSAMRADHVTVLTPGLVSHAGVPLDVAPWPIVTPVLRFAFDGLHVLAEKESGGTARVRMELDCVHGQGIQTECQRSQAAFWFDTSVTDGWLLRWMRRAYPRRASQMVPIVRRSPDDGEHDGHGKDRYPAYVSVRVHPATVRLVAADGRELTDPDEKHAAVRAGDRGWAACVLSAYMVTSGAMFGWSLHAHTLHLLDA